MVRARARATLTYALWPRLSLGIEYNPAADEVGPLANLVVLTEGTLRPALIAGTSSDRIGTPSGRSYYATLSKDLSPWLHWEVAPYAGAAYGTFEDELRPIGGLRVGLGPRVSSTIIHDGVDVHPTLDVQIGSRHVLTLLLVAAEDPGIAYSVRF